MVTKKKVQSRKNKVQSSIPEYDYSDDYYDYGWNMEMSIWKIVLWAAIAIILLPLILSFIIAITIYFAIMDYIDKRNYNNKYKGGEQNGKQKR